MMFVINVNVERLHIKLPYLVILLQQCITRPLYIRFVEPISVPCSCLECLLYILRHMGISQYSHVGSSPEVTKHHGCSLNSPGLRQAFPPSATIMSIWPCISNATWSTADQALHTVPDTVLLIGPWYSLPFLVIRHSVSTNRKLVY